MRQRGLTIRATPLDNARMATIAAELQTTDYPYATKTSAIRFALKVVAEDVKRFVAATRKAQAAASE
jgi:hypothetical protein